MLTVTINNKNKKIAIKSVSVTTTSTWGWESSDSRNSGYNKHISHIQPKKRVFSCLQSIKTAVGPTRVLCQWVWALFSPKVKQPQCDADHSPMWSQWHSWQGGRPWGGGSSGTTALGSGNPRDGKTQKNEHYKLLLFSALNKFRISVSSSHSDYSPLVASNSWGCHWVKLYLYFPICFPGVHRDNFTILPYLRHNCGTIMTNSTGLKWQIIRQMV